MNAYEKAAVQAGWSYHVSRFAGNPHFSKEGDPTRYMFDSWQDLCECEGIEPALKVSKHTPVTYDPDTQLTSRFCVCRVGGGYSVEDQAHWGTCFLSRDAERSDPAPEKPEGEKRMKIVTYTNDFGETIEALTQAEYAGGTRTDFWDEFVWQDQPSKAAAIARHNEAFEHWQADNAAGRPIKEVY